MDVRYKFKLEIEKNLFFFVIKGQFGIVNS